MKLSQRGLDAIKAHEGLRLRAYDDGAGVLTIGYGHTAAVRAGDQITAEQAEQFLREDVEWAEACVRDAVHVSISQAQFDALTSLVFNIGAGAFRKSTLLQKLNAGDYSGAAQEFVRWNQAGGRVMPGLTKRRLAERDLFTSQDAPEAPTAREPEPAAPTQPPTPKAAPMPSFADVVRNPATAGLLSLVNPLLGLVPAIARAFMDGGKTVPERNVAVAVAVADAAQQALAAAGKPAENIQQVVETIAADPEAREIAKAAIAADCVHLVEAGGGGIEGARKADAEYRTSGDLLHSPSFWIAVLLLPLVYMIVANLIGVLGSSTWSDDARAGLAGSIVGTIIGGLCGYYYGQTTSRNRTPAA